MSAAWQGCANGPLCPAGGSGSVWLCAKPFVAPSVACKPSEDAPGGRRMAIMLRRYSGFPPEIFERGIVPQMKNSALRLYLFLCRHSDRKSSRQFKATDAEIGEQVGSSPGALRHARKNLLTLGLIHCEKAPGGAYTYSLCDVNTKRPFPGDPKVKAPYKKKEKQPASQEHKEPPQPLDRSWARDSVPAGQDTSFNYGHNAVPQQQESRTPISYSPF